MSRISHILLSDPVVVPAGTALIAAARLMNKNKVASVLVSRNGRLAGIVSVEDIMQRVAEGTDLDIPVDEVMHSPELMIDSDKWLSDAISIFERSKATHIAVVEHGEKVGIIRAEDILHTYRYGGKHEATFH
ncbi:MAG TPA: CBS domain-containing protein [Candidatus Methanoperedenaceae archaeon]|nr:CBS domain-containing protein [Candidatus Methanoperedenaceae archaeon]